MVLADKNLVGKLRISNQNNVLAAKQHANQPPMRLRHSLQKF